jgi:dTDP-4-dehydrorhamnose 3,5-epimerase
MIFKELPLKGAFLIDLEKRQDERGFFARSFCEREFAAHHLTHNFVQFNNSLSKQKGTLRGLHFQQKPHEEDKLVRCIQGSIFDVLIDLRPDSPTYRQSFGYNLTAENRTMMYVPKGFAHGFLTLEDKSELFYLVSEFYTPEAEKGIRWNDPSFTINWPIQPVVISEKDKNYLDFSLKNPS